MEAGNRVLRIEGEGTLSKSEAVEVSAELGALVDDVLSLETRVKALKAKHKKEIEALEHEYKEKVLRLKTKAARVKTPKVVGLNGIAEFTPTVSREIPPRAFARFLADSGQSEQFWDYVSVGVTNICKDFGEAVLERAGVLTKNVAEYSNVKIIARPQ